MEGRRERKEEGEEEENVVAHCGGSLKRGKEEGRVGEISEM